MPILVPMPEAVTHRQYRRKAAHWLVSVDLGKYKVGWARWWVTPEGASLAAANTLVGSGTPYDVARLVVDKATDDCALLDWAWVCEWPVKYPTQRKFHAAIDDLHAVGNAMSLDHRVGRWSAKFRPHEWKGNVPKPAHHARLRAALGTLDIPESEHDTWDALGIGAFALGLTRRGAAR